MPGERFWSSSTYVNDTSSAWGVSFSYGRVGTIDKANYGSVRCVRYASVTAFCALFEEVDVPSPSSR